MCASKIVIFWFVPQEILEGVVQILESVASPVLFPANAFLAAALTRVMRAAVPILTVGDASVLHSATVGGSIVGVVRSL